MSLFQLNLSRSDNKELYSDETELRAHGNVTLGPGIDFFTLRQWYNQQNIARTKKFTSKSPQESRLGRV
jgi:hypothetical protein